MWQKLDLGCGNGIKGEKRGEGQRGNVRQLRERFWKEKAFLQFSYLGLISSDKQAVGKGL
ncbi:hypothetical protein TSUD_45600 [Trifolium subterraneum]|nr:hypothetical protein TSUD_45600 [Trifolium subterraneum]